MHSLLNRSRILVLCLLPAFYACKKNASTTSDLEGSRSSSDLEGEISADLKEFRDQLVGVKDQNDVAKLIDLAVDKVTTGQYKDNDVKFVAAQLIPLKAMRGIIWRMTPLVEDKNNTIHSAVVTSMMAIAAGTRIFVPQNWNDNEGSHTWKSVNRYLAWPHKGLTKNDQFKTVRDLQNFLSSQIAPLLGQTSQILEGISIPANKPIVWDNLMIFGRGAFGGDTDSRDRYATLYEGEKLLTLSGIYAMRHNILFFKQYNFDDFIESTYELGHLVGLDGFGMFGAVNGASAKDRAPYILKYPKLFKRIPDFNVMQEAYGYLDKSTEYVEKAWAEIKARGSNSPALASFQLLDPAKILPWTRLNDATVTNIRAMVKGQPVRSAISGKVITVDVPKFYKEPPEDLKSFMPTSYDSADRRITVDGVANVRNYEYGMSTDWNSEAYAKYFPGIKSGKDVPLMMRDLSQVWGGWFANVGLASASMVF